MGENRLGLFLLGAVLLIALAGVFTALLPAFTGQVSAYQQLRPFPEIGGVAKTPDPHTQYIVFDEGLCKRVDRQDVAFENWVIENCARLNPGRQKRKGDCIHDALVRAATECTPAPVFENIRPPVMLTGRIVVNPLDCANLAKNYDIIVQQTAESSFAQTIALINPCTGSAGTAARQSISLDYPPRDFVRAAFASGDLAGHVTSQENTQGNVQYVRCIDGSARVIVSGTILCNTLG
jgi:hypothetical protein